MQMLTMVAYQLKLMFRNRIAILATISVPLLLTYLFSFSQGSDGKMVLYVADLDQSTYSTQLINMLNSNNNVEVKTASEDTIKAKVDSQDLPLGLVIGQGFGHHLNNENNAQVRIIKNFETSSSAMLEQVITGSLEMVKQVVKDSQYASQALSLDADKLAMNVFENLKTSDQITVNDQTLENGKTNQDNATVRLIGFLVMFIWFVVVQGLRTFIDEREDKTFHRIISTPISYFKHFISKMLASYLFGIILILVILITGQYILKVKIADHYLAVGIVFAAYLFALTAITLVVVPFMKDQKQFTASTSILIAVTGILGGSFFPMEIAPKFMQNISMITPERWAIQTLKAVIFNGSSLYSELIPLGIFAGVGVLALGVSFVFVNRSLKV